MGSECALIVRLKVTAKLD